MDWLFRRLGDMLLSTITSSICSLEKAPRPAKVIPLVLQCLSESHDDFASICWETYVMMNMCICCDVPINLHIAFSQSYGQGSIAPSSRRASGLPGTP